VRIDPELQKVVDEFIRRPDGKRGNIERVSTKTLERIQAAVKEFRDHDGVGVHLDVVGELSRRKLCLERSWRLYVLQRLVLQGQIMVEKLINNGGVEVVKERIPAWDVLRIIGKSKIVSLTILVPFIGYLILFNNELVAWFSLSKELVYFPSSQDPISPDTVSRLHFLYFGLTFLGLSSIGFSVLCPKEVKEHQTVYDYINSEMAIGTDRRFKALAEYLKNVLEEGSTKYSDAVGSSNKYWDSKKFAEIEAGGEGYEAYIKADAKIKNKAYLDLLGIVWAYEISRKPYWRLALSVLYLVGFLLVLCPSGQVFFKVFSSIFMK